MARRKTRKEAKAERITWFALVLVIMLIYFDRDFAIPDFIVPFILAGILLISGVYQYTQQGWRVSPLTWIIMVILVGAGLYDMFYTMPAFLDLRLASLLAVIVIIALGALTNEA